MFYFYCRQKYCNFTQSFFKRVHDQTHNHVDLLYSLEIFRLLSEKYFNDIELGISHKFSDDFREFVAMRLEINNIEFYKYTTHYRITYTINDFISIKRKSESNLPQYA